MRHILSSTSTPETNEQVAPADLSPSTVEYHRVFDSFINASPPRQQPHLPETIFETQHGSSSEPAPDAAVPALPSAEGHESKDNGKTKQVRGGYQKLKEVRIPPYVKNKRATEHVYVYREEDKAD